VGDGFFGKEKAWKSLHESILFYESKMLSMTL